MSDERPILLIVDDDAAEREAMTRVFRGEDYVLLTAGSGAEALEVLDERDVAVVLTDLRMPGMDGQALLEEVRERRPAAQVLVITGYGTVPDAVEAMQAGALDFLQKPLDVGAARVRVRKAVEKYDLRRQNLALREQVENLAGLEAMVGRSPAMQEVYRKIRRVAPTSATVLILGESGTGKELVARAIHNLSPRRDRRFLPFNCAAVTRELVESELFGYNRGAFTGATRDKPGYFEEADGGTLFLDEIGEMTPEAQAKLLRVLEAREIIRVGATRPIPIDVRILASTNRNLSAAIAAGDFREDLYHRLRMFPIELPPLRERVEDIPLLAAHFLKQAVAENSLPAKRLDDSALDAFRLYSWPGNVRELRNLIHYLVLSVDTSAIRRSDLPDMVAPSPPAKRTVPSMPIGMTMEEIEREAILRTLEAVGGNKSKAAKRLGIALRTLYRRLEKYGAASGESGEDPHEG
jgi:DNA-binding NtrC family response regulator